MTYKNSIFEQLSKKSNNSNNSNKKLLIQNFLSNGGNINIKNKDGDTLLSHYCFKNDLEMVKFL